MRPNNFLLGAALINTSQKNFIYTLLLALASIFSQTQAVEPTRTGETAPPRISELQKLPAGLLAQVGSSHFRGVGPICLARLSPDGTRLVVMSVGNSLRLFDVEDGHLIRELKTPIHGQCEQRISWSSNGKLLAVIDVQGDVHILDGVSGKTLSTFTGAKVAGALLVRFGPDDRTLLVARPGKMPAIDITNGKTLREFDLGQHTPAVVVMRREGTTLDIFTTDKKQFRWKWADASFEAEGRAHYLDFFKPSEFHVDGSLFNGDGRIINYRTGPHDALHQITTNDKQVRSLARSADNQWIAAGHEDGEITLWSTQDKTLAARWQAFDSQVGYVSLSQDGQVAAAAPLSATNIRTAGNRAKIWKKHGQKYQEHLPDNGHRASINWLSYSNDLRQLISASSDHTLGVWDLEKRERIESFEYRDHASYCPESHRLSFYRWNPEGRFIHLCNLNDQEPLKNKKDFLGFYGNSLSPDGKTLSVRSYDSRSMQYKYPLSLTLWDVFGQLPAREIEIGNTAMHGPRWSPDSTMLATGNDLQIAIWNAQQGKQLLKAELSPHVLNVLCFTPDSKHLLGIVEQRPQHKKSKLQVWNIASQQLAHEIEVPVRCYSVAVLKDNRRVLLGGIDGTLRVYDLTTEKLLKEIPLYPQLMRAVAISPDEQQFATGHEDSAIFLWDAKILPKLE
jgi:WD40 repeat protein